MRSAKSVSSFVFLCSVLVLGSSPLFAVGPLDDFQNGTTQGWRTGFADPDPPINIPDGGPDGMGDGFMSLTSDGGFGAGSKLTVFNQLQWAGDYLAEDVDLIAADIRNFGNTDLQMRLQIDGPGGIFVSEDSVFVPAGAGWRTLVFRGDYVGGFNLDLTLSSVTELRIFHNPNPTPSDQAPGIVADVGIDNIQVINSVDLALSHPTPGIAGQNNTFFLDGATPGARVGIFFGFTPGPLEVPICPGEFLGFLDPLRLTVATADPGGVVAFTRFIPPQAAGLQLYLQAIEPATCRVSNRVVATFE